MAYGTASARHGLGLFFVVVLLATFLAPLSASADTNLEIGGTAVIAYADGDDVRLREDAGYDAGVIRYVPEGATVDVLDWPVEDGDGNFWYLVSYRGDTGYIVSDYLALDSTASAAVEASGNEEVMAASEAIGFALISGTNGDGVRCRADADPGAFVITVVPEDTTVELTGGAIGAWQPINCAGQGGYVHTDYVSYDFTEISSGDGDGSVEAAAIIGEAVVSGTNGDGVRCRTSASYSGSIITVLEEGSTVSLRDIASGDFQGVVCAGENGYAASIYLSTDGSSGGGGGSDEIIGSAVVSGTNGDGVRCRSDAGLDASVMAVLPEGTEVSVRAGGDGDWTPVVCAGGNGFVASEFLSGDGGSDGGGATGAATISGTNGDGVRCRTDPSFGGAVITVLEEGTDVATRGGQDGDWVPVICSGENGWVHADFIGSGGGGSVDGGDGSPSNSSLVSGDDAVVSGTNGDGVRLRAGASGDSSILTVLPEGTDVTVIDGSSGDWVAVAAASTSGFVHMDYLATAAGESGEEDDGGSGGALGSGDHALVTSALNLRYDPSFGSEVAAVAPDGIVVEITGRLNGEFYPVDWDGIQGYMHMDYLIWTDEALSESGGSSDGGSDGGGGAVGGGNGAVVDFAMQYLGYPYVWATHGPSSFDCSGFTYWVILNTLGIDIGAGTFTQIDEGKPVSQGDLQPGDLVFFQNTYTWGLSHVGIYIGGGQFIHAENESTGVVISDLGSSYYSSRWYGARRIG